MPKTGGEATLGEPHRDHDASHRDSNCNFFLITTMTLTAHTTNSRLYSLQAVSPQDFPLVEVTDAFFITGPCVLPFLFPPQRRMATSTPPTTPAQFRLVTMLSGDRRPNLSC